MEENNKQEEHNKVCNALLVGFYDFNSDIFRGDSGIFRRIVSIGNVSEYVDITRAVNEISKEENDTSSET
jgi:hypothetical protein